MKRFLELSIWIAKHGLINLKHRYSNSRVFDTPLNDDFPVGNSSITDSQLLASYPSLCGLAATDVEIFKKFRSAKVMITALDHVSIEQGNAYLSEILNSRSWSETFTEVLDNIDKVGKPKKI